MYTSEQLKRYLRGEQTVSYSDNPAPTVSEGAKAGTSDELKQYLASIHYPASEPAAAGGSFFRRAADTVKSIATPENAAYTQQMKAYDTALAGIERQMADLRDSALQEGTARYLVGEGNFTSDGSLDRYQELGAQKQTILRERENLNLAIRAVEFAKLSEDDVAKLEEILSFENWGSEDQSGYIAAMGGMSPWAQPTAEYRERESRVNQYREELKQKYNYDFLHDYYTRLRNAKRAAEEQQKWQEFVNQGPVEATLANLYSVPAGLAGGVLGALDTARQRIGKEFSGEYALPIDANSQYYDLTKAANAIREQTAQNIDNGVVNFLYQTGMSGLDSLAASLIPGGAASRILGGTALLSTSAGTNGFLDAKARGASDDEAIAYGAASGIFEGLFESVSIGKLVDTAKNAPKTFQAFVKDGLVSMGVNASEETFTEIADVMADSLIMGDLSQYNLAVKAYKEQGYSEAEARNKAAMDTFGQIAAAGLGGAIMGGAFTGVGALAGNIRNSRLTRVASEYESLANANESLLGTTAKTNAQQAKQVADFLTASASESKQDAEYTKQAVHARDNIGQWLDNLSKISRADMDQRTLNNVQLLRTQLASIYNYAAEKAAAVGSPEANNYAIQRIANNMLSEMQSASLPESRIENVEDFLNSAKGSGMNPDTVSQLAQLAQRISLPIRVDESLGAGVRAAYDADTKTVYVNPKALTSALSVAHELTHAAELLEEYPQMRDYILGHAQQLYGKSLSELIQEKQEQYRAKVGQDLTREEAELEIVAGVFDNVLTDENFLRRLHTADRGLFFKLYRWVRYQLLSISNAARNGFANAEERSRQKVLLRAQYMMENLVSRLDGEKAAGRMRATADAQQATAAGQNRETGPQEAEPAPYFEGGINTPDILVNELERGTAENERNAPLSPEEFYNLLEEQNAKLEADRRSRRRRQYSLNEKFKDEYDAWDKKTAGGSFYIGNTSDALESIGVRNYGFYWDKSKIVKIKEEHPDMTDDVIKRVPEILENPVLIMESLTVPGRITLYGEVTDAKGIPVLVAVELNPSGKNGRILDMAKVASAYGRKGKNATQSLIDRSPILYVDPNKNRTDSWSRALRLQLPAGLTNYGPINTIAQRTTGVNNQSMQKKGKDTPSRRKFSAASQEDIENIQDGRYTEDRGEENGRQTEYVQETAINESWNQNEQTDRRRDKDNTGVRESGLRNHAGYLNRGPQEFSSADPGGETTSNQVRGRDGTAAGRGTQKYGEVTLRYQPTNEAAVASNARQARDGFAEYGIQAEIVNRIETDRGGGADDFNRSGNVSAATTPDGKILIYNTEGSSPENVVNHELVHYMRRNTPDLYQAMENVIRQSGVDGSVLKRDEGTFVVKFIENYEYLHPGISMDTPHFYEELLSYVSGLHAQDPDFARQVFGAFIRDYDAVVDAITSSLDKFKKAQAQDSPQRESAGGSSMPETHIKYSVNEDKRLSSFFGSVLESKNIPEDYKERIKEESKAFYYEVEHNEETLRRAVDRVLEDPDRALSRFLGKNPKYADRTDIAVGMILQSNLLAQKDYAGAVDVTEKLQEIGTRAGQSVQAFTFLNRMTPDGMVYYVSGTLDKVYNELSKGMGRKAREKLKTELKLTEAEAEYIWTLMQAAQQLRPGRERDIVLASITELVNSKIPSSLRDKLKAWLRISMLLNPKTMIRNVVSNVLMYPAHLVSDTIGTAVDKAAQRWTGTRTTGLPDFKGQLSGARKGAFESFDDFRRHINTREITGRYEIRREGTPFNRSGNLLSRSLAKLDSLTGFLLDVGDRPFFEAYFINSLNNQMRLNKVSEPTADMMDVAMTEALQRTWQDDNKYTKAFGSIRRALNFGGDFGLGTIAVPFTKTPANLVKALVDFSPFGLIRGLTYDIAMLNRAKSNGEGVAAAQRRLVRDVANSFVGTMLMMTGYVLAANGVVTGSGEDDKDAAAYSRDMMGISPYSFTLGDGTSVSYDWAAPIGTLIGIGADVKKELDAARDSGDDFVSKLLDVLGVAGTASVVGANTLFEQSLFTGIRDLFGGTYGTIPEGILGTALNLPSQFVPTFLSQIAQALDPYQRVQYVKGNELQSTLNEVIAKIPGLRNTLEIKRNNFGGYVNKNSGFTTIGAGTSTILNTFLNPANVNTKQPTELQKQLWELYEKTGNEAIFPSTAPDSFSKDGKKYTLSPEQKVRYLDLSGEYYTQQADKILDSHRSNEEKAAELADLVTKSRAYAKEELIKLMEEDD